ncbi:MAG: hypothetical protein R3254_01015 [Thiomicrorhabdus sp.]|nr:hypothetical protein [Thiomicrorhabdus sp.]
MFRADLKTIFSEIVPSEGHCEDCPHLQKHVEEYEIWGCKDREVELDCTGSYLDCHRAEDIAEDVELFIADNTDMFNFIECFGGN